jgi:hypothetical protein
MFITQSMENLLEQEFRRKNLSWHIHLLLIFGINAPNSWAFNLNLDNTTGFHGLQLTDGRL